MRTRTKSAKIWKRRCRHWNRQKQRVANEKKKQNEKKRKAENYHKCIMGGIIVKYFPDCYSFGEDELKCILSVALQTRECQQMISKIKAESTVAYSMPKLKARAGTNDESQGTEKPR